jgi:hypothetical protein
VIKTRKEEVLDMLITAMEDIIELRYRVAIQGLQDAISKLECMKSAGRQGQMDIVARRGR